MGNKPLLSIMGDSISTYHGQNPPGYAVYYDAQKCSENGLTSPNDTWWMIVADYLGAEICVNDSFSGSKVALAELGSANRDERVAALADGDKSPDIILVYIGFNDFGYSVPLRKRLFGGDPIMNFESAYDIMLEKITARYPEAKVICSTLARPDTTSFGWPDWPHNERKLNVEDYSAVIRQVCAKRGVLTADLESYGIRYDTLDGAHPTAKGHRQLAEIWIKELEKIRN